MAGHRATPEDVKLYGGNMRPGDFLIDPFYNNEGGLQAYYDHVSRSNSPEQADAGLVRAGQSFQSKFKEFVGRDPTSQEFSNFYKDVLKGDDVALVDQTNKLRPIVNEYVQDQYSGIAKQEQEAQASQKGAAASGDIRSTFQSVLGRDPTKAELDHFGQMIGSGAVDLYTLGQGLQTLPEYTQKKDEAARGALRDELSKADTDYLQKQVFPALQSQFAQQGRVVDANSPALAAALANAAKETNDSREQYLATIGHEDYANQRQQVINNYLNNQARAYQIQDQATARTQQLEDRNTARSYEIEDYLTQQRAYNDFLANYGRRQKSGGALFGGLQGAFTGAMAGGMAGGPWGAVAGGIGGGTLGAVGGSRGGIF